MKRAIISASVFILIFLSSSFVFAQSNNSKEKEIRVVNRIVLRQVREIVFETNARNNTIGYGFVLRFTPSFDVESQITIENKIGKTVVTEYRVIGGSIDEQLNKLIKGKIDYNAEELAKHIRVEKRVVKISPNVIKQWREEYYKSLSLSLNVERKQIKENMQESIDINDGTKYSLWYSGAAKIFYEFSGGSSPDEPIDSNESALINWMKKIKSDIAKSK